MTDKQKAKTNTTKPQHVLVQERLNKQKINRQQRINKPTNFRPQGRGR